MMSTNLRQSFVRLVLLAVGPLLLLILFGTTGSGNNVAEADETSTAVRRVNVPYFANGVKFEQTAIFWFGRVDNQNNYVDVRVGYDNDKLWIRTAATDRRLWYNKELNKTPNVADLPNWDAVTIFLDTTNNGGNSPSGGDYRFVSQLNWWEPRTNYNAAYKGSGDSWVQTPFTITAKSGWRGNEPNDNINDRGWSMTYEIPWAKLGLSGPPTKGTAWGLGVALHDRDTAAGPPISIKTWPGTDEWQPTGNLGGPGFWPAAIFTTGRCQGW